MSLRYDFASISPASRDYWEIPLADQLAELKREQAYRARAYPARIAKGTMTQDEASAQRAMFDDIIADLQAVQGFYAALAARPSSQPAGSQPGIYALTFPLPRRDAAFPWETKLHALRREIGLRRRFYPDWIGKGRLSEADARAQLERLEAVQANYWLNLWCWVHPLGPKPADDGRRWHTADGAEGGFWTSALDQWRSKQRQHWKRIEAAIGLPHDRGDPEFARAANSQPGAESEPEKQKEMAL